MSKPRIFIAVDIESTGQFCPYINGFNPQTPQHQMLERLIEESRYEKKPDAEDDQEIKYEDIEVDEQPAPTKPVVDELIAFSTVAFTVDPVNRKAKVVSTYRFVNSKFMVKRKKLQWAKLWKQNNWEWACWDRFWSKHYTKLDRLGAPLKGAALSVGDVTQIVYMFSMWMLQLEQAWDVEILTDTGAYDLVWLTNHLWAAGQYGMAYNRNGSYRGATNVHSMIIGRVPHMFLKPWKELSDAMKPYITADPLFFFDKDSCDMFSEEGAHLPEWDAFKIAVQFCAAVFGLPAEGQ